MKEEKKDIYIVTSGEYSDYTIERVFSTEAKAREYLDTKDDDYRIEVYNVDEPVVREEHTYCIEFGVDRKDYINASICGDYKADLIHIIETWGHEKRHEKRLEIYVKSDSYERAVKVASERFGAIIANQATMYPYLFVKAVGKRWFSTPEYAYFDFKTGELILLAYQQLCIDLPDFIKVKKIDTRNS